MHHEMHRQGLLRRLSALAKGRVAGLAAVPLAALMTTAGCDGGHPTSPPEPELCAGFSRPASFTKLCGTEESAAKPENPRGTLEEFVV